MRAGVRIAVDVGKARIGVARCDPHAMLATPFETVARATDGNADIDRLLAIAHELDAIEIIVGLPLGLGGHRTPSTDDAEAFAQRLASGAADRLPANGILPVRLVDERLSTVAAQQQLRAAGRTAKKSKNVIDQAAATIILEHALDIERAQGVPPGVVVVPQTNPPAENSPAGVESDRQ